MSEIEIGQRATDVIRSVAKSFDGEFKADDVRERIKAMAEEEVMPEDYWRDLYRIKNVLRIMKEKGQLDWTAGVGRGIKNVYRPVTGKKEGV